MELDAIKTTPRQSEEAFCFNGHSLGFQLGDFWSWNQSNLIENRNRGILAEYLVRQALGLKSPTRFEWDAFDLITETGIKIEIKSASYIQTWKQKKYSSISFDIKPTKVLLNDSTYSTHGIRQADIYIFCLLHHLDQATINPMELNQWTFYLTTTKTLDKYLPDQMSMRISTLKSIPHEQSSFYDLKKQFEKVLITATNLGQ